VGGRADKKVNGTLMQRFLPAGLHPGPEVHFMSKPICTPEDPDPVGGFKTLARTDNASGLAVTMATAHR
jgi:hypothetical protein